MSYIEKEKWEGPHITIVPANPGFYAVYSYDINEECSQVDLRAVIAWHVDDRTDLTFFTEPILDDEDKEGFTYQALIMPNGIVKCPDGARYNSVEEFKKQNKFLVW